jgi:hypothetical protein
MHARGGSRRRRAHSAGPRIPGLQLATVVAVQQPTFDMSVLRAVFDPGRTGHEDAVRLLKLAAAGMLQIGVPPQGARADFRGDMTTPLARRVLTLLTSPGVVELRQLAVSSDVTLPGPNFFPESPVQGFAQAWATIDADWNGPGSKPGSQDRWYVESHVARGRDVLVTDDQGMQTMCGRLRDEHDIQVTARSLADYAALFPE